MKSHFKALISKTIDGTKLDNNEHLMLVDLLKFHKRSEEKLLDLDYFTVGNNPDYPETRCFFVVTKDGIKKDFSVSKCIKNMK